MVSIWYRSLRGRSKHECRGHGPFASFCHDLSNSHPISTHAAYTVQPSEAPRRITRMRTSLVMNHHLKMLPVAVEPTATVARTRGPHVSRQVRAIFSVLFLLATIQCSRIALHIYRDRSGVATPVPVRAAGILDKCQLLQVPPGPAADFHTRRQSDRFVSGTKPTLITVSLRRSEHLSAKLITVAERDHLDRRREWSSSRPWRHTPRRRTYQESRVHRWQYPRPV